MKADWRSDLVLIALTVVVFILAMAVWGLPR